MDYIAVILIMTGGLWFLIIFATLYIAVSEAEVKDKIRITEQAARFIFQGTLIFIFIILLANKLKG